MIIPRFTIFIFFWNLTVRVQSVSSNSDDQQCTGEIDTTCKVWKWDIDAEHRCNIKKMTVNQLYDKFNSGLPPLYHEPVILYNENPDQIDLSNCIASKFTSMMSIDRIQSIFPEGFEVTLSSSNSFSAHRRIITLAEYIDETIHNEILPNQLSNETWYLFGETYSQDWKEVLNHYCLPPCKTCTSDLR